MPLRPKTKPTDAYVRYMAEGYKTQVPKALQLKSRDSIYRELRVLPKYKHT